MTEISNKMSLSNISIVEVEQGEILKMEQYDANR